MTPQREFGANRGSKRLTDSSIQVTVTASNTGVNTSGNIVETKMPHSKEQRLYLKRAVPAAKIMAICTQDRQQPCALIGAFLTQENENRITFPSPFCGRAWETFSVDMARRRTESACGQRQRGSAFKFS